MEDVVKEELFVSAVPKFMQSHVEEVCIPLTVHGDNQGAVQLAAILGVHAIASAYKCTASFFEVTRSGSRCSCDACTVS